jgi:hypothetical protein
MSFKITIKGEAFSDYGNLSELDGIDCQDNFVEYFDSDFSFKNNIESGYMYFLFKNGKLWTVTEYFSDRELSKDELEKLSSYTQGQWSDGIGEGFEQEPCYYGSEGEDEIFISPWKRGQELETTQISIL